MSWLLSLANAIGGGAAKATTPYGSPIVANKTSLSTLPKTTQTTSRLSPDQITAQPTGYNSGASKDTAYTLVAQNPNSTQAYSNYVAANPTSPLQQFGSIGGSSYSLGGGSLAGSSGRTWGTGAKDDYGNSSPGWFGDQSGGGGGQAQMPSWIPPAPMPSFTAKPPTFSRIGDYQRPDMPEVRPTDMGQAPARYQRDMTKYRKLLGEVVQ